MYHAMCDIFNLSPMEVSLSYLRQRHHGGLVLPKSRRQPPFRRRLLPLLDQHSLHGAGRQVGWMKCGTQTRIGIKVELQYFNTECYFKSSFFTAVRVHGSLCMYYKVE